MLRLHSSKRVAKSGMQGEKEGERSMVMTSEINKSWETEKKSAAAMHTHTHFSEATVVKWQAYTN